MDPDEDTDEDAEGMGAAVGEEKEDLASSEAVLVMGAVGAPTAAAALVL